MPRLAAVALVLAGVAFGLWAIGDALSNPVVPIVIVAFGIVATIPWLARAALLLVYAAVVAMLALVGFNMALGFLVERLPDAFVEPGWRLPIKLGLVVAVVVFGAAAYFYLRGTWVGAVPVDRLPERLREIVRKLHLPTSGWPRKRALALAAGLAVAVIIGLPPFLAEVADKQEDSPGPVPVATRIGSDLDVLIIADRQHVKAPEFPPDPARGGFLPAYSAAVDLDVRYSVGVARGTSVDWTNTGISDAAEARAAMTDPGLPDTPAPQRRRGGDSVIVLMVDGTPPVVEEPDKLESVDQNTGGVKRWEAIAIAARSGDWKDTPVHALLQTTNDARLGEWDDAFKALGGVVSIQRFGSQTATDTAVRLAVGTPTAVADFWLAMRHRPILLFDSKEPVPRPLSIEQLFKDKRVRQCPDLGSQGTCGKGPVVESAADLESPGMHLVIDRPRRGLNALARREHEAWQRGQTTVNATGGAVVPAAPDAPADEAGAPPPGTPPPTASAPGEAPAKADELLGHGSRVYVHPVSVTQEGQRLLYLDYWWYLPDNPTGAGKGAFCGAGLVILGVTCFDHESDWEGVTVVLERSGDTWSPRAVHYAQHESVVRYEWPNLRAHWNADSGLSDIRDRLPDFDDRPVVFIASGTHAAYAHRCRAGDCKQVATDLEEGRYNGGLPWVGDDTEACLRVACLFPLPTAAGGRGPATWNAFRGPWGRRRCAWTHYCDSGTPPPAPGQQDRYRDPARFDGGADVGDRGSYEEADGARR